MEVRFLQTYLLCNFPLWFTWLPFLILVLILFFGAFGQYQCSQCLAITVDNGLSAGKMSPFHNIFISQMNMIPVAFGLYQHSITLYFPCSFTKFCSALFMFSVLPAGTNPQRYSSSDSAHFKTTGFFGCILHRFYVQLILVFDLLLKFPKCLQSP